MKFSGIVKKHLGRGKKLGFPTANIEASEGFEDGIYFGLAIKKPALIFIGASETFDEHERKAEIYILDFAGDLYDQKIEIEIIKKLRENKKFDSQEALIEQMKKDESEARAFFRLQNILPPLGEGGRRPDEGGFKLLPKRFLDFSRALRIKMTPWETKLWSRIRGGRFYGLKFRRQVLIDKYIVDFYCHARKLIIELDGGHHNEIKNQFLDSQRQKYLESQGYIVLRFWNNDIDQNLDGVLETIKKEANIN